MGVAYVAAGFALLGAYSMMDALLVEWRAREQTASVTPAPVPARPVAASPRLEKPKDVRVLASVAMVKNSFSSAGYSLDAVRRGQVAVPRLLHASLPYDLKSVARTAERKTVFLHFMLPYILQANMRVREQRDRLLTLRREIDGGNAVAPADQAWLDTLFDEYRVKPGNFAALVTRVDMVPPSLALAQAAVESGWGTSRFAHEGNAPFGQWTSVAYLGMVPKDREAGKTHMVRAFKDLSESVDSYLRNLNTHRAYRQFRQMRAERRAQNAPVDSIAIAAALDSYSSEGDAYVALVRRVIKGNNLRALDEARLSDTVILFKPGA